MADEIEERLSLVENTVSQGAGALSNLLNVGIGPAAITGFIAEGIFKGIRLGRAIKRARRQRNETLDTRVRARGVLRTPIVLDLSDLDFLSFYIDPVTLLAFPALEQFKNDIAVLRDKRAAAPDDVKRRLKAARQLVLLLKDDPDLSKPDHQDLRAIFEVSFTPEAPDLVRIVNEYAELFPEEEMTYREHYARMREYWKDQIVLEVRAIQKTQIEEQEELSRQVSGLVTDSISGNESFAGKALGLAANLKVNSLDKRIEELTEAKDTSDDPVAIDTRITHLKAHRERLKNA